MTSAMRISHTLVLAMVSLMTSGSVRAQVDTIASMTGDPLLKDIHGLVDAKGRIHIEGNGYNIFAEHRDQPANQEAYAKTQKKVLKGSLNIGQDDPALPIPNRSFELRSATPIVQTYYCAPSHSGGHWLIGFATVDPVDRLFEQMMVRSIHENNGYAGPITEVEAPRIDFCGREIELGPACHWRGPHNCQCSGLGQMNWSMPSSMDKARTLLEAQLKGTTEKGKVVQRDSLEVIFEGDTTTAVRIMYKVPNAVQFLGQTTDHLTAYYVVAEVRGRSVCCVLSHYGDPASDRSLPPLLAEVMTLR